MPLESLFLPEFLDLSGFLDLKGFLNPLEFLSFCLALKPELEKKNNLPELHPPSFHGITQQPLLGYLSLPRDPQSDHIPLGIQASFLGTRMPPLAQSSSGCAPQVWDRPWPCQNSQAFFCSWWCKLSPELSQDYFLDRLIIPRFLLSHPIKPQHCPPLP